MNKKQMLWAAFLMAAVFTGLDTLVHYFFEPLELYHYPIRLLGIQSPLINYAISKLASSTVLLFVLLYIVAKLEWKKVIEYQIVIITLILMLEVRYILGGYYTAEWHILNFINHYVTLSIGVYLVAKYYRPM